MSYRFGDPRRGSGLGASAARTGSNARAAAPTDARVALSALRRVMELRSKLGCLWVTMSVQDAGFGFIDLGKLT